MDNGQSINGLYVFIRVHLWPKQLAAEHSHGLLQADVHTV